MEALSVYLDVALELGEMEWAQRAVDALVRTAPGLLYSRRAITIIVTSITANPSSVLTRDTVPTLLQAEMHKRSQPWDIGTAVGYGGRPIDVLRDNIQAFEFLLSYGTLAALPSQLIKVRGMSWWHENDDNKRKQLYSEWKLVARRHNS